MAIFAEHFVEQVILNRETVPSFENYPFHLDAVRTLDSLLFNPKVTFFVGENGSGKSTLLEAIAVKYGFNAEGGSKNFNFSNRASHSVLHQHLTLSRGIRRPKTSYFLRAESFFNVATEIENLDREGMGPPIIDSYGGQSLHEQSHGESFLSLVMHRFGPEGLYILDEPEAALSPSRLLALLVRIHDLTQQNCQFIIATHSPILMAYPEATIYSLGEDGAQVTTLEDTTHWSLTASFMRNPQAILDELFEE